MRVAFKAALATSICVYGAQASQHELHSAQHPLTGEVKPATNGFKVAIIGAGAAGTSAAFWLSRAKSRLGENVTITIYDKNNYIGGRSTTVHPYNDEAIPTVELGASIYVDANKNMVRAVKEFNLSTVEYGDENEETGIWNGNEFVLTLSGGGWRSWWTTAKLFWRYGYSSPLKVRTLVKEMINTYLNLYRPRLPYSSITAISSSLNFTHITAVSASKHLIDNGVNPLFVHELVEAATRVNYGQNVDDIHALEGMVSMAASGAHSVAGGNWRMFERWAKESGANVHLGTTVKRLHRGVDGKWRLTIEGTGEETYDAVVLAAPYKSTGIKLEVPGLDLEAAFPPVDYVHLHVTLLATKTNHPQGSYFFPTAPETVIPQSILTASGPTEPEFNSLTYHERIQREGQPPEYIVKIFSKSRLTDEWLEKIFGAGNVGWIHRKEWDAYPRLPPTATYPSVKPAAGLYYVNALSREFISTMETETIASLNAVDLLLHDHYGRGVCGYKTEEDYLKDEKSADFVYGWDC
ncbi:Prenylcysteine lyase-domain-containing protein [Rhizoctonia solani]|nr:Prenylcysteine lyase-domain-containing protein [Rhizoctonia solani]